MSQTIFSPIREGDSGLSVVDIRDRLHAIGFPSPSDPPERFGAATLGAVKAFQASRSLTPNGIIDSLTWDTLTEAGWQLGDRVLYERLPWMRGDDIAELQERLANLGFDLGKVDGIFGPSARRAVSEFQRNCGLPIDGIAGTDVIAMLARFDRAPAGPPNPTMRERLMLESGPSGLSGRRIFIDPSGGQSISTVLLPEPASESAGLSFAFALDLAGQLRNKGVNTLLSRSADTNPSDSERAGLANWFAPDVVLSIAISQAQEGTGLRCKYFGRPRYQSSAGQDLASLVSQNCSSAIGWETESIEAAAQPILRETRSVAVVLDVCLGLNSVDGQHETNFRQAIGLMSSACASALDTFFRGLSDDGPRSS